MSKLLRISSSILGSHSVSSELSGELIEALQAGGPKLEVIERNFDAEPIPHFDGAWLGALMTPAEQRTAEQQAKVDFSDRLIAEVQSADILVIALPMYNFTLPSMLKAWVDHVARAGVTFKYTDKGPVGLLQGKKVYFVATTGGDHEQKPSDFLRPYLTLIMNFLGITDIEIVSADGLNMGAEPRALGLGKARASITSLANRFKKTAVVATTEEVAAA